MGVGTIPISAHGGVNFYIGNARSADGMTARLPGLGAGWNWEQVQAIAESELRRPATPADADRLFWSKGFSEINADPGRWIRLMGRKFLLFWNHTEISNNQDFYYHAHLFPLFGLLMWIGFPLSLAPSVWGTRGGRRDGVLLLLGIIAMLIASVVVFFVNSRFRHPVMPLLFILAGGGIVQLVELVRGTIKWRKGDWRWVVVTVIIAGLLPFAINSGVSKTNFDYGYFTEGAALELLGKKSEAEQSYKNARAVNPTAPYVNFKLGELARERKAYPEAIEYYRQEIVIQPGYSKVWNNLGTVLLTVGDEEEALRCFGVALEKIPPLPEARRNMARIWGDRGNRLLYRGDKDSAQVCFRQAVDLAPEEVQYRVGLARSEGSK